ncbi:NfeD family protein [Clostridium sp. JNZ J1-5]
MSGWWNSISSFEKFFWVLAIPFSALFIIQMFLLIIGIEGSVDDFEIQSDIDLNTSTDIDDYDNSNLEPNAPLKLVTLRNIIIFFTIFSWTGIMGSRNDYSKIFTVLLGVVLGSLVILILSIVYKFIIRLTESGNMNLKYSIGATGQVYLTILENGKRGGKVQVTFQSSLRELDAITYGDRIPTGVKIIVIGVEDNYLVVKSLEEKNKGE